MEVFTENLFRGGILKEVSSKDLEELMTVKDIEGDVSFYVKDGSSEDHVEKLLMFVLTLPSFGLVKIGARDCKFLLVVLFGVSYDG